MTEHALDVLQEGPVPEPLVHALAPRDEQPPRLVEIEPRPLRRDPPQLPIGFAPPDAPAGNFDARGLASRVGRRMIQHAASADALALASHTGLLVIQHDTLLRFLLSITTIFDVTGCARRREDAPRREFRPRAANRRAARTPSRHARDRDAVLDGVARRVDGCVKRNRHDCRRSNGPRCPVPGHHAENPRLTTSQATAAATRHGAPAWLVLAPGAVRAQRRSDE
jgi:hypothetical protein